MGWKFIYFQYFPLSSFLLPLCISSPSFNFSFYISLSLVLSFLHKFTVNFIPPYLFLSISAFFSLCPFLSLSLSLSLFFLSFLYHTLHTPIYLSSYLFSSLYLLLFLCVPFSSLFLHFFTNPCILPYLCLSTSLSLYFCFSFFISLSLYLSLPLFFHSFEVPFFTCGCGLYHEPRRTVNNNLK